MLIFTSAAKGGSGKTVTGANVAYRRALQGSDVAYVDFDFGSAGVGSIFHINATFADGGTHSYLSGFVPEPALVDVWTESVHESLRGRPRDAGALALVPADRDRGDLTATDDELRRMVRLLVRFEEQFEVTLIELGGGLTSAAEMVLRATAAPELRRISARWLVFLRWTQQHIDAAGTFAAALMRLGREHGHDGLGLTQAIRFVPTAIVDVDYLADAKPAQLAWLHECRSDLQRLASDRRIGRSTMLASVPLDPLLQWREQLITDVDVRARQIAGRVTTDAYELLAKQLDDDEAWSGL